MHVSDNIMCIALAWLQVCSMPIRENTLHSIMDGPELQPYSYNIMSATQVTQDVLTYTS